jgi:hypothetical protein
METQFGAFFVVFFSDTYRSDIASVQPLESSRSSWSSLNSVQLPCMSLMHARDRRSDEGEGLRGNWLGLAFVCCCGCCFFVSCNVQRI